MSGVFGLVSGQVNCDASLLVERIGSRLLHRPYHVAQSTAVDANVGLGRMSIAVFNRESQPVRSADGLILLVLCGELYHQSELRAALVRSGALQQNANDAELALAVYLRDGAVGLTTVEGAFTIAVWDGRRGELVLVNDRFGLYPHYYSHKNRCFVFAPEIKALLCVPQIHRQVNRTAIAEYVRFQQLLGDKTWFEDVSLLPAATLLRFRPAEETLTLTRYWDWDKIGAAPAITFDDAVEECTRLLQRAIDEMIQGPYRFGVYLSGGLDGRTILGFVDGQVPLTSITYGAPGCRDVVYATELARRAGSRHVWFPFHDGNWVLEYAPLHLALTEGMHSWMHLHGISTQEGARQLIDVNLSGWDGATVFGGYVVNEHLEEDRYYRRAPSETDLLQRQYETFCQHIAWPGLQEAEAATLFSGSGDTSMRWLAFESLRTELMRTAHYPEDRRVEYFYINQHDRRSTQNLVVFMRSALEQRCPFFDYDFLTFMYSLPEHIRSTPALRRAVLTRRMPTLMTVPYEKNDRLYHSNPVIHHSHATWQRLKRRLNRYLSPIFPDRPRLYADYENYLRTDLREWAEGILFDQRTLERGFFDPAAVRSLWQRHLAGKELWTIGKIAPLVTVELVLRSLYDDPDATATPDTNTRVLAEPAGA
ncbi:MAG: asparagine synthetase B family protein [Chloroflexota bacterium]